MIPQAESTRIRAELLRLAEERGRAKTFCPSEAARNLAADWRPLLPAIRHVAARLVEEGRLLCTQGGRRVDPEKADGPIRLSLPSS